MKRWLGGMLVVFGLVFLAAPSARAEDVVYQKHTVVDFGDDTIDGSLSKPDGAYLDARKKLRHQKLIKVRTDFRPEILRSVRVL